MEMGKKRFCPRLFFGCRTKMANLGDLLIYAVFESYKRDFTDKIEVKNPNFVQALDKNVFVSFLPFISLLFYRKFWVPKEWKFGYCQYQHPVHQNGVGTIPKAIGQYSERGSVLFRNDVGSITFWGGKLPPLQACPIGYI